MKIALIAASIILICATGCSFSMGDEGKMWLEVGMRAEVGHSSSETAGNPYIKLEVDEAVTDYLFLKDVPVPDLPPFGDGLREPDPDGDPD